MEVNSIINGTFAINTKRRAQGIRPTQYVTTYGPGSIIESINGPHLILRPDKGLIPEIFQKLIQGDFTISNENEMARTALPTTVVFRIPSNSEVGFSDGVPIYNTTPFPKWKLCVNKIHRQNVLYRDEKCPQCRNFSAAIRFIAACGNGHMSDVPWDKLVHKNRNCQNTSVFLWFNSPKLTEIRIRCEQCDSEIQIGKLREGTNGELGIRCTGEFLETGESTSCNRIMRIVLRQSSSLRIPYLETLFSVPPKLELADLIFEHCWSQLRLIISTFMKADKYDKIDSFLNEKLDDEKFNTILDLLSQENYISNQYKEELRHLPIKTIRESILRFDKNNSITSLEDAMVEEFNRLKHYSQASHSEIILAQSRSDDLKIKETITENFLGHELKITPIALLNTLIIQRGYIRNIETMEANGITRIESKLKEISFEMSGKKWLPGIKFKGEGLFITSDILPKNNEVAKEWDNYAKKLKNEQPSSFFIYGNKHFNSTFVWWHTFSHLLIRVLAENGGYSAPSLREKIYITQDKSSGAYSGGVVIYTAEPGYDSSFGGLISLTDHIKDLFESMILNVTSCSEDPLCSDTRFPSKTEAYSNGSACYACLFLSETSCAYRNLFLDRNIIRRGI